MLATAKGVEADYPEYEVSAHFGFLYHARLRGSSSPLHVEADSEAELRRKLDGDRAARRFAQQREAARNTR